MSWVYGLLGVVGLLLLLRLAAGAIASTGKPRPAVGRLREKHRWRRARLTPLRNRPPKPAATPAPARKTPPYPFARREPRTGNYVDLVGGGDRAALEARGLPALVTPQDVADWLGLPLGKVAWLTGRFDPGHRPPSARQAHYVYSWKAKRAGGVRLLESPKPLLKQVQTRILREILDRVPPHPAAHGFAAGRSIRTNAVPHCGKAFVVKWDLENFYAGVRFNRVVAIFRSLGYGREAAIWLASLTTSAIPADLPLPEAGAHAIEPYLGRHLPQGAPTSPALANLSAYSLDVRLSGLATSWGGVYTRYADDLTISGGVGFGKTLRNLIPLVEQVIRQERFRVRKEKRKVLRSGRRQSVAGVVVNAKPNVARDEFDRLKATLHNAVKLGPESQNRDGHADFAAHLRGRIAHVAMLNPARGAKLMRLYERIRFG